MESCRLNRNKQQLSYYTITYSSEILLLESTFPNSLVVWKDRESYTDEEQGKEEGI